MPNWKEIHDEIKKTGSTHDHIRRQYLGRLNRITGRNVIVYYSGWLQKAELSKKGFDAFQISDTDKTGFMSAVNGLDKSKGLDLILHTPGGDIAATESLVDYLHSIFDTNIRAIVPEIAMSCGTMMALACKEILMGKHSSLGPIDPQFGGIPAHGIIEEFERIANEIQADPNKANLWRWILAKYNPTLVGECQKAMNWSKQITKAWLIDGMFRGEASASATADRIVDGLSDHGEQKTHARHISSTKAESLGLKVIALERDKKLQDAILSAHHACIHTLFSTPACKIIENHKGTSFILSSTTTVVLPNA